MDTTQQSPAPGAPGAETRPAQPDLGGLAAQMAAKHGAGSQPGQPGAAPAGSPKNKGGRGSQAEEAQKWLAANNLVAVPAGGQDPAADPAPVNPGPVYVVDPAFIAGAATTLARGIETWRQRKVAFAVMRLTEGDKALAAEFAEEAAAPPGCLEVIGNSLAEVFQKYGWLAAAGPEVVLVGAIGIWWQKDAALMRRLEALGKELAQAKEKPADATKP